MGAVRHSTACQIAASCAACIDSTHNGAAVHKVGLERTYMHTHSTCSGARSAEGWSRRSTADVTAHRTRTAQRRRSTADTGYANVKWLARRAAGAGTGVGIERTSRTKNAKNEFYESVLHLVELKTARSHRESIPYTYACPVGVGRASSAPRAPRRGRAISVASLNSLCLSLFNSLRTHRIGVHIACEGGTCRRITAAPGGPARASGAGPARAGTRARAQAPPPTAPSSWPAPPRADPAAP